MNAPRNDLVPSLTLAAGAALWGLYWIPIRAIEQAGAHALWAGPTIFGASTLLFLPLLLLRRENFLAHWRQILLPGLLAGFAFALYIASLNLTDVVRAILLFYLSPLWSTLLGMLMHYLLTRAESRTGAFIMGTVSQLVLLGTSYFQLVSTSEVGYFFVLFRSAL